MEILPVIRVTRHRYGGAGVGWGTRDVRKVYPLILISSDQNGVAVLDAVLRSSREVFPLNIFPVTAQTLRGFDKGIVFYFQPFTAVKVWVQGLLPSLRAFYHHGQRHAGGTSKLLLTIGTPGSYAGCDQCPLLAILLHAHDEQLVLALGPLPFFEPTGHRVMPSFPTVFVGPAGELVCDATPISHITTV